jgi:hypothetical protein
MIADPIAAGWAHPSCAKVHHYFRAGSTVSLCDRIGGFDGPREDRDRDDADNCRRCARRLAKLAPGPAPAAADRG